MLHENRTWKAFWVEFLGINTPRTVIVRTQNEAIDVAVNEFSNTAGFFGGIWGLSPLLDKWIKARKLPFHPDPKVITQGRVFKSAVLIPLLLGFMVSMPYVRNALTAWRSGTVKFKNLITENETRAHTKQARQKTQESIRQFLTTGIGVFLLGAAVSVAAGLLTVSKGPLRLFQGKKLIPSLNTPWGQRLMRALSLTGDKATEFGDMRAIIWWGIPTYLAWMAASRDSFERKEQFLKMINFILVFLLVDKGSNWFFNRKMQQFVQQAKPFAGLYTANGKGVAFSYKHYQQWMAKRLPAKSVQTLKRIVAFENARLLTGIGSTILFMATFPALLNIYLTKRRLERDTLKQATTQSDIALPRPLPTVAALGTPQVFRPVFPEMALPQAPYWPMPPGRPPVAPYSFALENRLNSGYASQ